MLISLCTIIILMHSEDRSAAANPAPHIDLYSLEPSPHPITSEVEVSLRAEALSVHELYQQLEQHFYEHTDFYVVSAKWFKRWQVYVGYEEAKNDLPSGKVDQT